jgi:hypothetical protein
LYFGNTPLHLRKRVQFEKARRADMTQPASLPLATPVTVHAPLTAPCTCMWCKLWGRDWRRIRRSVGFASLVANIAVIAMMLATAYWENHDGPMLNANVTSTQIQTTSDIDLLHDAH